MDYIKTLFHTIAEYIENNQFSLGFFTGVFCVCIIILIFAILLLLIKSKRKVSQITLSIPENNGNIQVSSAAIRDFVKEFAIPFSALQIRQVHLIRQRKKFALEIRADYKTSSQDSLPQLATTFQQELLAALSIQFGINEITNIHLLIRNSSGNEEKALAVTDR